MLYENFSRRTTLYNDQLRILISNHQDYTYKTQNHNENIMNVHGVFSKLATRYSIIVREDPAKW